MHIRCARYFACCLFLKSHAYRKNQIGAFVVAMVVIVLARKTDCVCQVVLMTRRYDNVCTVPPAVSVPSQVLSRTDTKMVSEMHRQGVLAAFVRHAYLMLFAVDAKSAGHIDASSLLN